MRYVEPIRDLEIIRDIRRRLYEKEDKRDYIFFQLGINTGYRISDLLSLRVHHIRSKEIRIVEKKTRKQKTFAMNPSVRWELVELLKDRDDYEFIIKSREGTNKPLTRSMTYKIIREIASKYNIEGGIGNHTLRKTYGYHFYLETKNVAALQNIFNHSDPSITLRYIGYNQDTMNAITKSFKI